MSEELTEAVGAVLGLIFAGFVLLAISAEVNTSVSAQMGTWGLLFLIVAFAGSVLIVYAVIENLLGGL
jgi:hypothetical protein